MEQLRDPTHVGQKSWQVLSVALAVLPATTCPEWCRDHSPLKRVLISGGCVRVAGKGSPSLPGQGTAASNSGRYINLGKVPALKKNRKVHTKGCFDKLLEKAYMPMKKGKRRQ
jgi:hypothetical protein